MSFVTSHLGRLIAEKHKLKFVEVATGFKWISFIIEKYKKQGYTFLFGYEESYGSLVNDDIARDKDSIQAAVIVSEMANYYKAQGKTLWDALYEIYDEYKYFFEHTSTIEFSGANATRDRVAFMNTLRDKAPSIFKDEAKVVDLSKGKDDIAPMDLIKFEFKDGSWISIRPSGTEPKIKFYQVAVADSKDSIKVKTEEINKKLEIIMKEGK